MDRQKELEYLQEYAGYTDDDIDEYEQAQNQIDYDRRQAKAPYTSLLQKIADGTIEYYKKWYQIRKDLERINSNNWAIKRLVAFLFPELKQIVNYPVYVKNEEKRGKTKFVYNSLADVDDVENCIIFALFEVATRVRDKYYDDYFKEIDIRNKDLRSIKKVLAKMIRNAATKEIYKTLQIPKKYSPANSNNGKKVVTMDNIIIDIIANEQDDTKDPATVLTKKELKKIINNTIDNFLREKDELDKIIFLNHIIVDAKYEKYKADKFTQDRIAYVCKTTVGKVRYREGKILEEFQKIWTDKVEPYL